MTNDVGISFNADSFKQFNKTLEEFTKISTKVDSQLTIMAKGIGDLDRSVTKLDNTFSSFNGIITKIDSGSIQKLISSFDQINSTSFSNRKIQDFASGFKTLMQAFTERSSTGGIDGLIARFRGSQTIFDLLNKFGSVDVSKIDEFASALRKITFTFGEIHRYIDPSKIKTFAANFRELLKAFSEDRRFGKLSDIGNIFKKLRGSQNIFTLLKDFDFSALANLGDFSKSIKKLGGFFNSLSAIRFDLPKIKEFGTAMRLLTKEFTQITGFRRLFRGFLGDNSVFGQLKKIGDIKLGNLSGFSSSVSRLVNTLKKINEIRVDPKQTRLVVDQIRELAKISANSFQVDRNIFIKIGSTMGSGLISGFKKILGISSPSKVFITLGKNTIQGFAKGVQGAMGLARSAFNGIVNAAKRIVSPITGVFSFIKDRMVFTFGDLQRIAQQAFRAIIGTTIEFESSFTGVLKTLDTSQIFAQGGEEGVSQFIEQLRSDLIGLSRDSDSMVAGLENSFVRLSSIAEAAGQLGVAAEDVVGFTEVIGQLSIATDFADEEAAFFLAKFTSITGDQSVENFERLGGTIVHLGNNLAVTESQIGTVAQRIVAAGTSAGLSQDQILGWSAAIKASGLNAEAGSTSFIQFTNAVTKAVSSDDLDEMEQFSELIGLTGEAFAELFEEDPNQIFVDLIGSLGQLNRTELIQLEEQLGLDGIRLDQFIASLGTAEENSQVLTRALSLAAEGLEEFGDSADDMNALQEETSRRMETSEFAVNRMKNAWLSLSNTIGTVIQPAFNAIVNTITDVILKVEEFIGKVSGFGLFAEALGIDTELGDQQELNNLLSEREVILSRLVGTATEGSTETTFIEHQFEVGDTLFDLAKEHGVTVEDILEFNETTLEDYLGFITSVKIPLEVVAADGAGDDDAISRLEVDLMTIDDLINNLGTQTTEETSAQRALREMGEAFDGMDDQIAGIKDGFNEITSGNIGVGLGTIATSLGDIKDNAKEALEIFLGESGVDTSGLNFAEILISTFTELFGVDLTPVYEFVKTHYIDILSAGFALLTGSSITLAIPVARILLDVLGDNFGSVDSEAGGSGFLGKVNEFVGSIGSIVSDAFGDIGGLLDGQQGEQLFGDASGPQLTSGITDGGSGGLIAPIINIISSSAGQLAAAFGEMFVATFIEVGKNIPSLISSFAREVISPFLEGVGENFKDINNVRDLGEALLGGLETAIGLVFGIGLISSLLTGGGIIASISSGFATLLTVGLALINPITIGAALVGLVAGLILSEDFRNEVGSALQDIVDSAFDFIVGDNWQDDLVRGIEDFITPIGIWIANAINDVGTFLDILFNNLETAFLGLQLEIARILDKIPTVNTSDEQESIQQQIATLDRQNENLRLMQDLQKGGEQGVGAFWQISAGFDPENLDAEVARLEDLGLPTLFAERLVEDVLASVAAEESELSTAIFQAISGALADKEISDEEIIDLTDIISLDPEKAREAFVDLLSFQENNPFGDPEEFTLGNDIINGIITGLESGTESEEYLLATQGVAADTEALMRQAFESQSPSKLTARIGEDLMRGLVGGMGSMVGTLTKVTNAIVYEIGKIGGAAFNAANDVNSLISTIGSLIGTGFSVSVSGMVGGGQGRAFGGPVTAGKIYEVLEGNLPFELFRTGTGQTFMLPNESGMVLSPNNSLGFGGGGGGNSTSFSISVPVNFESVPTDVSDAQLNNISNRIATAVESRLQDGLREATLTDRFNRQGVV